MERDTLKKEASQMSGSALAFVGDAVFSLLVREMLCRQGRLPAGKMHQESVAMVRCEGQAAAIGKLLPHLTGDEMAIFLRGRNAHLSHVPKNAQVADYHAATGLEAVFGYLHLSGQPERVRQLFDWLEL